MRNAGGGLALEAVDRGGDQRAAEQYAGVVDQVARADAIAAVEHDVVAGEDLHDVVRAQLDVVGDDVDGRVQRREARAGGAGLGLADLRGLEQHLALQVGDVDAVAVEQAERADAGRGEVECGRGAEAPGAHHQHARAREFLLAGGTEFREQQVATVAREFGR